MITRLNSSETEAKRSEFWGILLRITRGLWLGSHQALNETQEDVGREPSAHLGQEDLVLPPAMLWFWGTGAGRRVQEP